MSNPEINQLRGALRYLLQKATTGDVANRLLEPSNGAVLAAKTALEATKPDLLLEQEAARVIHDTLKHLKMRFGLPCAIEFKTNIDGYAEQFRAGILIDGSVKISGINVTFDDEEWVDLEEMAVEYEL